MDFGLPIWYMHASACNCHNDEDSWFLGYFYLSSHCNMSPRQYITHKTGRNHQNLVLSGSHMTAAPSRLRVFQRYLKIIFWFDDIGSKSRFGNLSSWFSVILTDFDHAIWFLHFCGNKLVRTVETYGWISTYYSISLEIDFNSNTFLLLYFSRDQWPIAQKNSHTLVVNKLYNYSCILSNKAERQFEFIKYWFSMNICM